MPAHEDDLVIADGEHEWLLRSIQESFDWGSVAWTSVIRLSSLAEVQTLLPDVCAHQAV